MDEQPKGLLNWFSTPTGQGLLSAAAGYAAGARRGTPVNNIGRGLLSGVSGYQGAQQEQLKQQKEQRELAQQQKLQTLMGNPQASIAELMAAGAPVDVLRLKYDMTQGPKVHSVVQSVGADGKMRHIPIDQYGNKVGEGFAGYEKPERPQRPTYMNTNEGIVALDGGNATPVMGPSGGVLTGAPKGQSISAKQQENIRGKQQQVAILRKQIADLETHYGNLGWEDYGIVAGRQSVTDAARAYDAAISVLSPTIRGLTRAPGEGAMSDYESRLAQAQLPNRTDPKEVIAQKIQQLKGLADTIESGYADLLPRQQAQQATGASGDSIIQEAQDAIRQGAPAAQVIQELRKQGIDPSVLMRGSVGNAIGSVFQ